jgi:membrane protease YdiL (CAAX protease family)
MSTALRSRIATRPVGAFFVLTFLISWTLMTPAMVAGIDSLAAIPFFVGVFGPFLAAAIVTRATGTSVRAWLHDVFGWHQSWRWYAGVVAFPVALAVVASAEFALAGESLDFGLVGERAASFLPLLAYCLLLNGGPEELGWRGFALPRLLERFSPVRATVFVGTAWGLWHLPLLLAEDNPDHNLAPAAFAAMTVWTLGGIVAYAFTYTYVWNRTKSVFLCMLLHAAYNTALGVVILRPDGELVGSTYVTLSLALTGTLWLVALGLIVATRDRLGLPGASDRHTPRAPLRRSPVRPPAAA